MTLQLVCQGATCRCNLGNQPSNLSATSQTLAKVADQRLATIQDHEFPGGAFGICQALTARNAGTPTICTPSVSGTWSAGGMSPLSQGHRLLTSDGGCQCQEGGTISVTDAGQRVATV